MKYFKILSILFSIALLFATTLVDVAAARGPGVVGPATTIHHILQDHRQTIIVSRTPPLHRVTVTAGSREAKKPSANFNVTIGALRQANLQGHVLDVSKNMSNPSSEEALTARAICMQLQTKEDAKVKDKGTLFEKEEDKMAKPRTWYTYEFKRGNKILHKGITQDLERRESEHQANIDEKGHIRKVGSAKTEDGA